jgi:YHS domain-containing protein
VTRRAFIAAALTLAATGWARADPVNATSGVAIGGYDPVAYFTVGRPVRGLRRYRLSWAGATWLFASAEHQAAFASDPERYAPRYGGFCAYGVARAVKVKIDPESWSIVGGRLYLNYDKAVRSEWLMDPDGYIEAADRNWPRLSGR